MFDSRPEPHTAPDPQEDEGPPRDPFFNPYRFPKGDNVKAVVAEVLNEVQNYERILNPRVRERRAADQAILERTISAVVCDLIHRALVAESEWLAVSLSKAELGRRGRYRGPASTTRLPDWLRWLASPELEWAELELGRKGNPFLAGRRTTIRAGERLNRRIETHKVELTDLGEALDQETIILKRTRKDFWDAGDRAEYEDTQATHRLRSEMRTINTWLAHADIKCDALAGDGETLVDDHDRLLRRYFNNGRFDHGGRLFGGFWQPLSKDERHRSIRINGEPVATVDYGQMIVRIIYGMAGIPPPAGDLYAVPKFEHWREGIKKVFSSMAFQDQDLKRKPKGTAKLLPKWASVQDVSKAIREHHRPIAHLLDRLVGHDVFAKESAILVDVMLHLRDEGVVALPIHDAVVVPHQTVALVKKTMDEVAARHLGFTVPLSVTCVDPACKGH